MSEEKCVVVEGGKDVCSRSKNRPPKPREMKDHGAALRLEIVEILRSSGNRWTTAQDIADAVNCRARCPRPDGRTVTNFQVRRHTRNYSNLFERQGCRVRLRESTMTAPTAEG
jgi:hypothetical protein